MQYKQAQTFDAEQHGSKIFNKTKAVTLPQ